MWSEELGGTSEREGQKARAAALACVHEGTGATMISFNLTKKKKNHPV